MSSNANSPSDGFSLTRPFGISDRSRNQASASNELSPSLVRVDDASSPSSNRGRERQRDGTQEPAPPVRCINPASDINSRLDTQVEVRVYPCNNSQGGGKKKFTTFTIKPEVSRSFHARLSKVLLFIRLVCPEIAKLSCSLFPFRESLFKGQTAAAILIQSTLELSMPCTLGESSRDTNFRIPVPVNYWLRLILRIFGWFLLPRPFLVTLVHVACSETESTPQLPTPFKLEISFALGL